MDPSNAAENKGDEWKRPNEILKLKKKIRVKKRISTFRASVDDSAQFSQPSSEPDVTKDGKKRFNPFLCSPERKKLKSCYPHEEVVASKGRLFALLNGYCDLNTPSTQSAKLRASDISIDDIDAADELVTESAQADKTAEQETGTHPLPVDWSLKYKLKVVARAPFSFCANPKSAHTAASVPLVGGSTDLSDAALARCVESFRGGSDSGGGDWDAASTLIQAACLTWTHPHLPWMASHLFPRGPNISGGGGPRVKLAGTSVAADDPEMRSQLLTAWHEALGSALAAVRCGHSPYLYVCTHQFTALFRRRRIGGADHPGADVHQVLVTPTTRGFRDMLDKEEIEYRMPVLNADPEPTEPDPTAASGQNVVEGRQNEAFLESIGLSREDFRALEVSSVKRRAVESRQVDSYAASLVLIEGLCHVNAFHDFLRRFPGCVPNSGPLAGVPPTLLAPRPFLGATLVRCRARATRLQDGAHMLDLSDGPLLPQSVRLLARLFRATHGEFAMAFGNMGSTAALNLASGDTSEGNFGDTGRSECVGKSDSGCSEGTDAYSLEEYLSGRNTVTMQELRAYKNGLFSWTEAFEF